MAEAAVSKTATAPGFSILRKAQSNGELHETCRSSSSMFQNETNWSDGLRLIVFMTRLDFSETIERQTHFLTRKCRFAFLG
jgi:hypothetical protein